MTKSANVSDKQRFPYLASLIGGYFHQDFDVNGSTLEEIIGKSKADSSTEETAGTIADIERFVAEYGETGTGLAEAFARIFEPGVIAEGWDGMTTRQWLLRIAQLLR